MSPRLNPRASLTTRFRVPPNPNPNPNQAQVPENHIACISVHRGHDASTGEPYRYTLMHEIYDRNAFMLMAIANHETISVGSPTEVTPSTLGVFQPLEN